MLGCPQLSFDTSDFIEDNGNAKKGVSVLAWTIKESKVYTDIDPQKQFKDPFIFASGVKTKEADLITAEKETKNTTNAKEKISNVSKQG